SECARSYSPLKRSPDEGPFDVTDPNHFHAPYNMRLLPKYLVDIQVCGFCFWCGYSSQFLDHIVCHGYIDTGTVLSTCTRKEFLLLSGSRLSKNAEHLDHVESLIPNKILGSVGEEALSSITRKPKRRTSKEGNEKLIKTIHPIHPYTTTMNPIPVLSLVQRMTFLGPKILTHKVECSLRQMRKARWLQQALQIPIQSEYSMMFPPIVWMVSF
ncbi:unnamed protein product, partial [Cylicostephanus goldi]